MKISKVIHRKEAYLGAIEARVNYSVAGIGIKSIVYDDLDKLENEWTVYGNGKLIRKRDQQIARVDITVSYQDGRGQKVDSYDDLAIFKRHWISKDKFFEWERPKK